MMVHLLPHALVHTAALIPWHMSRLLCRVARMQRPAETRMRWVARMARKRRSRRVHGANHWVTVQRVTRRIQAAALSSMMSGVVVAQMVSGVDKVSCC